eukprot:2222996-Pyramimonas_sp.AAC.1
MANKAGWENYEHESLLQLDGRYLEWRWRERGPLSRNKRKLRHPYHFQKSFQNGCMSQIPSIGSSLIICPGAMRARKRDGCQKWGRHTLVYRPL